MNADAALLAQEADVWCMVARLNHLTKNQARRAVRVMAATHIVPTGIIVTGELDEPGYGYGYRYGFDRVERAGRRRGRRAPGAHEPILRPVS